MMADVWASTEASPMPAIEVGSTGYLDQVPFEGDILVKGTVHRIELK
jgi:hypothetical protein